MGPKEHPAGEESFEKLKSEFQIRMDFTINKHHVARRKTERSVRRAEKFVRRR